MIGSIMSGLIGQQGAQTGGDMASYGGQQAYQAAQTAAARNDAEAKRGRDALSPWTSAGGSALNKISGLLGLGHFVADDAGGYRLDNSNFKADQQNELNNFQTSPGYTFRKQEGINALDRSAAAKGLLLSGKQIKGVQGFGDGLASDEYRNYMGDLQGVSGQGLGATESANGTSAGLVGGGSNALVQGGNALFQGAVARGSGYAQGANALASGIGNGINNVMAGAYLFGGGMGGGGSSGYANDKFNSGVARGRAGGWLPT